MDIAGYLRLLARAQVCSADGDWAGAVPLWEQVVARNPVKGDHWAALARAQFAAKEYEGALTAYQKVAELGVRPLDRPDDVFAGEESYLIAGEVAYCIASCRARLGERAAAIDGLADALRQGFRDLDRARADESWAALLDDERVRDLLGVVDVEGLSRDEGWRADLRLLAREIKRRAYAPFGVISEDEFDRQVAELDGRVPELSDMQIMIAMMRLLRPLDDGHAFIVRPQHRDDLALALPLDLYHFEEGVYVVAAAAEHRALLGARIDRVGEHPVDAALAAVGELRSRDNDQQVRYAAPLTLCATPLLHGLGLIAEPDQATLAVTLADGSAADVTLTAVVPVRPGLPFPYPADWVALPDTLPAPLPLHLRNRDLPYWFEYLPDADLLYFQFTNVRDHPAEPLAEFTDRLFGAIEQRRPAKLVIDLRWNGGGNTFLGQPLLHRLIACPAVNRRGGLFVIIGRLTFSAAQNIVTAIERETNAIFVGEPTGSRPNFIGETIPFELPYSKVTANAADLFWQTSWPTDFRPWIAPDIYAPPTFEAFSRNADPAMDAILAAREHLPGS